jgi:hypothetical protein
MDFGREMTRRGFMKNLFFGGVAIVFMKSLLMGNKVFSKNTKTEKTLSFSITAIPENKNIGDTK